MRFLTHHRTEGALTNLPRGGFAFLGASTAYLIASSILLISIPGIDIESLTYPPIFLAQEDGPVFAPYNLALLVICLLAAVAFHSTFASARERHRDGLVFGTFLGLIEAATYVILNHRFNLPLAVYLLELLTYFVQWFAVGSAISLIDRYW